jgi:DNA-binding Lrp family transcriptional regulator
MLPSPVDPLDAALLAAVGDHTRPGVLQLSRQLGVARGTVQARLDRLADRGIVRGYVPDLDLRALGYDVMAFSTLEIAQGQGRLTDVVDHLRAIPEVLEVQVITGPGDLHCRVVARTHEHLQEVLNRILEVQGIARTTTVIALTDQIRYRWRPLVQVGPAANP